MSFKPFKAKFKVYSKALPTNKLQDVKKPRLAVVATQLAYEKIILKEKQEKIIENEIPAASENLDSSNIFKSIFKKGINPYRPEVVLINEYQPVATGNFDSDNNSINLNFGSNKIIEVTNVAKLIELHHMLKKNAIQYSNSLIRRYGDVNISSNLLIREMESILRNKNSFEKIYSKDTNKFKSNLVLEVKNTTKNQTLSRQIESSSSQFLNLCATFVLNKHVAKEIVIYIARLFDFKEKIEKSIELTAKPKIKSFTRPVPNINKKQSITTKNLLGKGLANFKRNASFSFANALGAVARKNSNNNLNRSNFENFTELTTHLYSLIYCYDTIKDLEETNYEIKNTISLGRKSNLKNSITALRQIKFSGCFTKENSLEPIQSNNAINKQTINNIISLTGVGPNNGQDAIAEILSAICYDQVVGSNFKVNQELKKIMSLTNNPSSGLRQFLSKNIISANNLDDYKDKSFLDFKDEKSKHGILFKKLFYKKVYENKEYIPFETNNTLSSNVYTENNIFPGEEIFFTSAIKNNDKIFTEFKNFTEDLENTFESISKNLIKSLSLGFDENGKYLDGNKSIINNLNPITYFNFHLKSLADEIENGFLNDELIKNNLPGLAICLNSAGDYEQAANTYCGALMGTLVQERAVPFWANDSWINQNLSNTIQKKSNNIYSTLLSECKYRASNGLKAILSNLNINSFPQGSEYFGRTNIRFDKYLFNDTRMITNTNFKTNHEGSYIGINRNDFFDNESQENASVSFSFDLPFGQGTVSTDNSQNSLLYFEYGRSFEANHIIRDNLNLNNSSDSYPYGTQENYLNKSISNIDSSFNGSLGSQDAAGCQFTKNATFLSRIIFNSNLGNIANDSSFELPDIDANTSVSLDKYSNVYFFVNKPDNYGVESFNWKHNNYPGNYGEIKNTSSVQRGLIFYLFAIGLLSGTQRIHAKIVSKNLKIGIKKSRINGLLKALRGQDISVSASDSEKHAYQEATSRIELVKEKILKRQEYILNSIAVMSDKIDSLTNVYKNLTSFIEGSDNKNSQFIQDKLNSNNFFETSFGLLNTSYRDYLSKSFVKNYGSTFGFFPRSEYSTTNDLKIMYKLFSQPNFGFLKKEKFGRKSIFNIGIPLGMIDYLRRESYKETGDEDYLDSSLIAITVYKNNQISSNTKYLPKQFVFDMSKHIMPFYTDFNGRVRQSNHVLRMTDDLNLDKILANIETLIFNDRSNFGFIRNGLGLRGIQGNIFSEIADNYENETGFAKDVLFNHVVDYYLRLYTQLTTGIEIDESTTLINSNDSFVGDIDSKEANNYKNSIVQKLLQQQPNIAIDEKTKETFFRTANSINNSFLLSSENRLKEMLSMPCFERIFSIFINERDFLLDEEDANELFKTQPEINRTNKIQRKFINPFNASKTNNKAIKNYIKELNDKHVALSGFSIDVGLLKKW